ncbi:LysR family transcriptional regulator [Novosphingobium colocasiae]|uniref:LysR family transcriptional regulator n=1 Tax=Novosphingobium colocasiae TaxID=1256513 RepID=UPI0035B0E610
MKRIAIYHLETLLMIARLGTFRAAAERLNTTQPAISARVREVELQLGVQLFRREGRRMVLTTRGRQLVQACEPHWAGLEQALMEASDFSGATGVVRIGSGEMAASTCLTDLVVEIQRDLPGVTMEVELDLTRRMVERLLAGTCDIVLLAGPVASPGVRTAPIGSLDLVWVANPTVAQNHAAGTLPGVWSLPVQSPLHGETMAALDALPRAPRSVSTCNNVRTLIDVIVRGAGAAVLPEMMIREELASGVLVEVLPRPARRIHFEVGIRDREQEPLVLELFRRAGALRVDPAAVD